MLRKATILLQDLQRKIYLKVKSDPDWRFWGLYVHICKYETLQRSYEMCKSNRGSHGIDKVTFEQIELNGKRSFLKQIQEDLLTESYLPTRNRIQTIPKNDVKQGVRTLGIPTIRDRVVQGALKLILEPIFEQDFQPGSYGYRPKRSAHDAIWAVQQAISEEKTKVIDVDLASYFDTIQHHTLLSLIAQRVSDKQVLRLVKLILKCNGKKGVPQGGVLSPLLSNLYLNQVDKMLEKAKLVTQEGKYTHITYVRFADDLVILVDAHPKWTWLFEGVQKRLKEELDKLGVSININKTKILNIWKEGTFSFLGFDFRRRENKQGKGWAYKQPQMSKRTSLLRKLKEIFRRHRSRPIEKVIAQINPILKGWVNYFRIGNSSKCFFYVKGWVEKKVRRLLMRARKRKGFGWKRWSKNYIYKQLGLFDDYNIVRFRKARPTQYSINF